MKSSIIAVGALLVAAAAAQPHRHQHRHAEKHQAKRDDVVWVTDYVDIVETVLLTATVWVDENGNTIAPVMTGTSTARSEPSTVVRPGVFIESVATPSSSPVAPVVTSSAAPVATSSAAPVVVSSAESVAAPAPSVEAAAPVVEAAPVVVSSAEPVVEPTPTPAPSTTTVQVASVEPTPSPVEVASVAPVVAAAQPTTSAAAAPSTGSSSGECSSGTPCSGDITYYEAGLGACGLTNNGETDAVVALPHGFMGTQSNGNPYCGKSITISKNGKTIQATVMDKCMGCVGRDLDLSNKAFKDLGVEFDVGRTTAEWWFN